MGECVDSLEIEGQTQKQSSCAALYPIVVPIMYIHVALTKDTQQDLEYVKDIYSRFFSNCKSGDLRGTLATTSWAYEAKLHYTEDAVARGMTSGWTIPAQDLKNGLPLKMTYEVSESLRIELLPSLGARSWSGSDANFQQFSYYKEIRTRTEMYAALAASIQHLELWLKTQ